MYINNVGTVALALARMGSLTYDKRSVSAWQAKQVATVSIWNAAGRILGGKYCQAHVTYHLIHVRNLLGFRKGAVSHYKSEQIGHASANSG